MTFLPARARLGCSHARHQRQEEALARTQDWLTAVHDTLEVAPLVSNIDLPTPDPKKASIRRTVDAENIAVMVARARNSNLAEHSLYIGLMAQDFTSQWLGLCGIFIPGCATCDPWGDSTNEVLVSTEFNGGWHQVGTRALPPGLRPGRRASGLDWFADRLRATLMPTRRRSYWRVQEVGRSPGPWLVKYSFVRGTGRGLLVCRDLADLAGLDAFQLGQEVISRRVESRTARSLPTGNDLGPERALARSQWRAAPSTPGLWQLDDGPQALSLNLAAALAGHAGEGSLFRFRSITSDGILDVDRLLAVQRQEG